MLSCWQATRLFSESQERPLSLRERMALRLHVAVCSGCRHHQQHTDILRKAARAFAKGAGEHQDE